MVPIRRQITTKTSIKCPYAMTPTRVVVHNTYNDAPAKNEANYMCSNDLEKSTHYFVDDQEIVQCVEENRNSWNAGDGNGKGNREGISVEICYSKSGGDKFLTAERNAAELVASILTRYGWGMDRVTKHQDYSGKYCPHRTLDMGWDRFLELVQGYLTPSTPEPQPEPGPVEVAAVYRVRTAESGWLPEVTELGDYAGIRGQEITDLAIRVTSGSVKYRVHRKGGGWLPWVTGYSTVDSDNGYAGDGSPIDAVQVYYYTPDNIRPYQKASYRVSPVRKDYYSWQLDTSAEGNMDGYAGSFGKAVDRFQLEIK